MTGGYQDARQQQRTSAGDGEQLEADRVRKGSEAAPPPGLIPAGG